MIIWQNTVFRGRSPEDRDAPRIKDELKFFLMDNPTLDFGEILNGGCMRCCLGIVR